MRITALGLAVCAALAASAPAALAQQMALVELPRVGDRSVRFLDLVSLRRTGPDVEVRMLSASATREDEAAPVKGALMTYRISCEWNAYLSSETTDIGADGAPGATRAYSPGMSFIAPKGPQADIAAIACDPAFKPPPSGAHATLKDAMAEAARTTRRMPALKPRDPDAPIPTIAVGPPPEQKRLQNFGGQGPSAYDLVHLQKETGHALFLDWGNFRREKDMIDALVFEVLAHDPAQAAKPRSVMKHSSVEIDCRQRVMRVVAAQTFGAALTPEYTPSTAPWLWRPVAGLPSRTALLDAACKGRKPKETLAATMADARDFVMRIAIEAPLTPPKAVEVVVPFSAH
jgi:hypothetical protein